MLTLDFLSNDYKEKKTQAQIVEENIEIDIITGKIPSGNRINERELCETYNRAEHLYGKYCVALKATVSSNPYPIAVSSL